MEIDNRNEYDILKEKTKVLAIKYSIGKQFINYIDDCDFLINSNDKIYSEELAREILLSIKNCFLSA